MAGALDTVAAAGESKCRQVEGVPMGSSERQTMVRKGGQSQWNQCRSDLLCASGRL